MSAITALPDLAASKGIEIKVLQITPEIAAEWLGLNTSNRPKKVNRIPAYARDMQNGLWALDGSPIRFSASGRLLDGQNRLYAVVATGATIESVVITGLADESQKVMDTGVARTLSDHLGMCGIVSARDCAAVAAFLERWERGGSRRNVATGAGGRVGTLSEANRVFWANEEIIHDAVRASTRALKRHPGIIQRTVLGGAYIVLSRIDAEDANEFFRLLSGNTADLPGSHHPVAAFVTQMNKERERAGSRGKDWKLGMLFKAWNAWRQGYETPRLQYNPGGKKNEPFPDPV